MSTLGLSIRIPRESLIKLHEHEGKEIVVKFNGGREVYGTLKSWDKPMNLILDNTTEILSVDENNKEITRPLGLIIVKGFQIQSICMRNGYILVDNPYAEAELQLGKKQEEEQQQKKQSQQEEEQEQSQQKEKEEQPQKNKKEGK